MFNRTSINTYNSCPDEIKVVEKKAPTDESIRLLNEFQQKAFDNVVACVQLSNNELKDITCWIYNDEYSFNERARVRFKLNGKQIDFNFKLPSKFVDSCDIIPMIKQHILDKLTEVVLIGSFERIVEVYKR